MRFRLRNETGTSRGLFTDYVLQTVLHRLKLKITFMIEVGTVFQVSHYKKIFYSTERIIVTSVANVRFKIGTCSNRSFCEYFSEIVVDISKKTIFHLVQDCSLGQLRTLVLNPSLALISKSFSIVEYR